MPSSFSKNSFIKSIRLPFSRKTAAKVQQKFDIHKNFCRKIQIYANKHEKSARKDAFRFTQSHLLYAQARDAGMVAAG
jgi:hypothetical protein